MNETLQLLQKFNALYKKYAKDRSAGFSVELFDDGSCYLNEFGSGFYEDDGTGVEQFQSIEELNSYLGSFTSTNDIRIHYLYKERG